MRPITATFLRWTKLVYALLAVVWAGILAWQVAEHHRAVTTARQITVRGPARYITSTLGQVIRSQRRWNSVFPERVESSLKELVRSGELSSIALVNAAGEVVVSAGEPINADIKDILQHGEKWEDQRVFIGNIADLGASVSREGETNTPTFVYPTREERDRNRPEGRTNNPAFGPPPMGENMDTNHPPGPPPGEHPPPRERGPGGPGGPRFGRPPWMNETEYQNLLPQRGLHGFVLAMSTDRFLQASRQDLRLRFLIGGLASLAILGLGLAWRNVSTLNELEMRLLRASEMNTHLQELSLAAAGLAHETRNPLNIIGGLAQLISKQQDASPEIRRKTKEIIAETDRVTVQLNEFINYSRPREVRPSEVDLNVVVGEVSRALAFDVEEKMLRLRTAEKLPTIQADEQLLRQALFNLLLNAVQAVERGGEIEVACWKENGRGAVIEIRDNGPGVHPDQRQEIFKPYFTTHQKGTGLGLAVVQQIVLAHGWEITCLSNEPRGAIFRISHVKLAAA